MDIFDDTIHEIRNLFDWKTSLGQTRCYVLSQSMDSASFSDELPLSM
jgi:hypothetical protein